MASILFFIETILRKQFRCKYLEKQTAFSQFFSEFLKYSLNFEDFQKKKKKMTLRAEVFPKLQTPKNMVISMPKKSSFKGSFGNQHS